MILKFNLYKPRSKKIVFSTTETEDIVTTITNYRQSELKKVSKNIPIAAKVHAETFLNISKESISGKNIGLVPVALYLVFSLKKLNTMDITIRLGDMQKDLGLSDKTITKALNWLEEHTYIYRNGRTIYVSPRLGFFGEPFDWSIALDYEKDGREVILERIESINNQLAELDKTLKQEN